MTRRSAFHSAFLLRAIVVTLGLVPPLAGMLIENPVPWETRFLIAALWLLAMAPLYQYLSLPPHRRRPIPFLPIISLMYGLYYALPLTIGITNQYDQAPVDPARDYQIPVELALLGWIAMIGGYGMIGVLVREKSPQRQLQMPRSSLLRWGLTLLFGSLAITILRLHFGAAASFGGVLNFIASLQWLGAGFLIILARRGQLGSAQLALTAGGVVLAAILNVSSGSVAPLVMLIAAIAMAFWIGNSRISAQWIIAGLLVIVFAMSLRGVAIEFRRTAWFGNIDLSQQQRAALMIKLLKTRVDRDGVFKTVAHGISATATRSATLDLFAHVVRRTPVDVPYWGGETYRSLVGSFVPRFLWPNKPTKELGQAFGHRYKILHWSNRTTAINLPILVEFYINFATWGVALGMLLVGGIYRALDSTINRPGQSTYLSMFGAVLLLPLLIIESDFSLVFGGIPLTAAALMSLWWMMRRSSSKSRVTAPRFLDASLKAPRLTGSLPATRPPLSS